VIISSVVVIVAGVWIMQKTNPRIISQLLSNDFVD
jgi:hypothetical protein